MVRAPTPTDGCDQSSSLISAERAAGGKAAKVRGVGGELADALAAVNDNGMDPGINSPRGGRRDDRAPEDGVLQGGDAHEESDLDGRSSEEIFSPKPYPMGHEDVYGTSTRATWLRKVRSVFCCFAPTDGEAFYHPTPEPEADPRDGEYRDRELGQAHPPLPPEGYTSFVIGPLCDEDKNKKTLVLDLDETLVHSSFKPVDNPDFIIPVDIDGKMVDVYVMKRPWLEHFMRTVGPKFEIVVFTASLSKYADPLLDLLDEASVVRWRLFREACSPYEGNFVKDLNRLGRDLAQTIIIDNSPLSYIFQPANALPIGSFMGEKDDQELLDIVPLLLDLEGEADVREYLSQKEDVFTRQLGGSNGMSLVPLGHGVGSAVVCESS